MAVLIALPVLGAAILLQTAVVSQITLLQGFADVVLLTLVSWALHERVDTAWHWALIAGGVVGWISALPIWVYLLAYGMATLVALQLRSRVWQIPILALFTTILIGTVIVHALSFLVLQIGGVILDPGEAFNLVTLPSLLLNLLLAIPVFGVIGELAGWMYPTEIDV